MIKKDKKEVLASALTEVVAVNVAVDPTLNVLVEPELSMAATAEPEPEPEPESEPEIKDDDNDADKKLADYVTMLEAENRRLHEDNSIFIINFSEPKNDFWIKEFPSDTSETKIFEYVRSGVVTRPFLLVRGRMINYRST